MIGLIAALILQGQGSDLPTRLKSDLNVRQALADLYNLPPDRAQGLLRSAWPGLSAERKEGMASYPERCTELPKIATFVPVASPLSDLAKQIGPWIARIRSIEASDDSFSDLEPLRKAIGSAHVVQLGEQSHGDGATFMAKLRIIRFLHEKCGFDVILWESGQFECDRMNELLSGDGSPADAGRAGVFPIWTEAKTVQRVFEYLAQTRQTAHPLSVSGFDPQFSGLAADDFPVFVSAFFTKGGEPLSAESVAQLRKAVLFLRGDTKSGDIPYTKKVMQTLSTKLEAGRASFVSRCGLQATELMARYLQNADIFADLQKPVSTPEDNNIRDKRMSENLLWLVHGRLKGKKVIVWAASFHLMHNAPSIDTRDPSYNYAQTVNMGQGVHEALGKDVYTLAFVADRGIAGNPFFGGSALKQAPPDSIEEAFRQCGCKYGFLNMRSLPSSSGLRRPQIAGPLGYSAMKAVWPNVFDGFFYTDVMFPSTLDAIPAYAR